MFFCIIIQRKVNELRNAPNFHICESASSNVTDWKTINWIKAEKYVDKQQKRIYKAEVNKDKRKVRNIQRKNISKIVLNINLAEDKGLFEPYVFNDTRAVLRSATS